MPVSFTTLQIYDQYLTTYRDKGNRDGYDSKNNKRRHGKPAVAFFAKLDDVANWIPL